MRLAPLVLVIAALLIGQKAAIVPPEYPPASNPDFLLNKPSQDPLAARYPWVPQALYYGGRDAIGPLDADWVWPDIALVDWNRDGLLDVVCALTAGTYSHRPKEQRAGHGHLRARRVPLVSRRDEIRRAPFRVRENLEDYGHHADLKLLESVSMSPSIQIVDWDGDGRKDLIVGGRGGNLNYYPKLEVGFGRGFAEDGSWIGGDRNGSVVFHKNLGMRDGRLCFSTGRRLTAGDDERAISYYDTATAAVADFNDDGRLDLMVASFDNLFVFNNSGSPRSPKLAAGRRIPVAGGARLPWERVLVMEANWSPSERHNLILQGSSYPWYLANTGSRGAPRYERIRTLLQLHAPVGAGDFAVAAAGDLNGDGKPDLVIGNEDGFLLYVENSRTKARRRTRCLPRPSRFRRGFRGDAGR